MAVSRNTVGTVTAVGSTSSWTVAYPSMAVGDVLLLFGTDTAGGGVTTPAGWTLLVADTTNTAHQYVYWMPVTSVLTGSLSMTSGATGGHRWVMVSYSGANTAAAPVPQTTDAVSGTAVATPSATFTGYAVMAVSAGGSNSLTAESSTTLSWVPSEASDTAGSSVTLAVVDGAISAGSTTLNATLAANSAWVATAIPLGVTTGAGFATPSLGGSGSLSAGTPKPAFPSLQAALGGSGSLGVAPVPKTVATAALAGAGSLASVGQGQTTTPAGPGPGPAQRFFDLRLVAYTPLGARIGPLPDNGITFGSDNNGAPTLSCQVSTVVAGSLPQDLEIAVEWWHQSTNSWAEGEDSRFACTLWDYDDRDRTGVAKITGVGIGAFLLGKAALNGVTPYTATGVRSEVAGTATISVSGTTFTWAGHILQAGDRVRITAKGAAKGINTGSVYFARNTTTNTFQISATPSGAIKNCGSASNVGVSRVVTRLVFTTSAQSFNKHDQVCVTGGASLGLSDGTAYYVINPTAATIQVASAPGGVPIELNAANTFITNVYRNLDGQRFFTNATPGSVMDAAFLEARDRGWGIGQDGTTKMLHGWTVGADSNNLPWATLANDPDTPGVGFGFQPGTPGTSMLQTMLDNQYAEWHCQGRTIHMTNYGTGLDHTLDTNPIRIGTTASKVTKTIDYAANANTITVRGVGNVIQTYLGTTNAWGRLELYETAPGATKNALATKIGKSEASARAPEVAFSVTEAAEAATYLPLMHYARGSWVAVQLSTGIWTRLRVMGWQYTKNGHGDVTVTVNLAAVRRHLITKIAKKTGGSTAGITAGSDGTPILESDTRKPAAPSTLTCTTTAFFAPDDGAVATITATWAPASTDINGGDLQVTAYQVWIRPEGALTGYSIAIVHGLTTDLGPFPGGQTYGVCVRAQSSTGQWGDFSPEVEVTTGFPVDVPAPPTVPILASTLGNVRISWDGNLNDPSTGVGAPPVGFAYVYAAVSTTSGGTYTPVGSNMGNAGYCIASGLTKGSTYWFGLFAVNTLGVASAMSTPTSITVIGVTGPDIMANSITTNEILAGTITTDDLNLGSVPVIGSPVDRVPMPFAQTTFWTSALASGLAVAAAGLNATSGGTGISLACPTTLTTAFAYVTAELAVPASGSIFLAGVTPSSNAHFRIREFNGTTFSNTTVPITVTGATHVFAAATKTYSVAIEVANVVATVVVPSAHVMEVMGTGFANGQAAELSPSGMRLYDDTGHLAADFTTATQQFLNVFDGTGAAGAISVASIDSSGNITGQQISAQDSMDVQGTLLTDPADPESLMNATPNNSGWPTAPLLDRLGRGCIYDCTWNTMNGVVVSTQFLRIAQDNVTLEDGRSYEFILQLAGLQISNNGSNINVYVELELNTVANTSPTSGTVVQRAVIFNTHEGYYALPPVVYTASSLVSTIDTVNRLVPAGVPIFWQLNTNLSGAPTANYSFSEFGNSRGLSIIDVGSSQLLRPNGNDSLANTTDRTTSGASSGGGSTSGGTPATPTTKTWQAAWSRSWNNSGSSIVSGSGQFTNGAAMYQGYGASPMGSKFGFAALGLAGKTITAMQLWMHADYFAYSGKSALLGTHGDSAAPATYTGSRANGFNVGWAAGQGKWVNVPSSLWAGFAAGTHRGFSLGVDGADGNYAYFEGATTGRKPAIKITYH